MVMSKAIEQVVSNNIVNSRNNNGGGVCAGGVAERSILQPSHAGGDGVYRRGNKEPGAVGGTGMMGKVRHAFGPGIGAPIGWMGNYRGSLGALTPPFSGVLSKCIVIDEEEPRSNKRLKSSNSCKGESISRSHPYTSLELGAFPQDFVKSHPLNPLGLDQFPQDKTVGSPFINISDFDEDNDGDLVKSQPFTPSDLNEFPRDSVRSPIIIISDSDEDNAG